MPSPPNPDPATRLCGVRFTPSTMAALAAEAARLTAERNRIVSVAAVVRAAVATHLNRVQPVAQRPDVKEAVR